MGNNYGAPYAGNDLTRDASFRRAGQKGAGLYLRIHRNSNYFPNGMAGGTGERGWRIKGASRRLWYKDLYNQRLLEQVQQRIARLESGACLPESYQIAGSKAFLAELHRKGVKIYIASGTDDVDVKKEVKVLGLVSMFPKFMARLTAKKAVQRKK